MFPSLLTSPRQMNDGTKIKILSRIGNYTSLSCSWPELGSVFCCEGTIVQVELLEGFVLAQHLMMSCQCLPQTMSGSKSVPSKPRMPSHVHRGLGTAAWTLERHWEAPALVKLKMLNAYVAEAKHIASHWVSWS